MIVGRFTTAGKTRTCPHCRATILDSATVCPSCHHHLRFDAAGAGQRVLPAAVPLRVEGTLRHPANGGAWEYSVVLAIRNDRGEEIARQVVGVGGLQPGDARTFSLAVEVFKPAEIREPKAQAADTSARGTATVNPKPVVPRAPARPGMPPTGPGVPPTGSALPPAGPGVRPAAGPGTPPATRPVAAMAPDKPAAGAPGKPAVAAGVSADSGAARGPAVTPGRGLSGGGLQPKRS